MPTIELPDDQAPSAKAANRIVIEFPDDHSIEGMKVEVVNVTPEQIAVVAFHLIRSANQVADMRQMQAAGAQADMARVLADLRKGH